jgi:hypothetical protein
MLPSQRTTARTPIASQGLKNALPWLIGIIGIVLIAFVSLGPHGGAPGDTSIASWPSASTLPPSATVPTSPGAKTPSTSSDGRVSTTPPTPPWTSDIGRGRPDPFAPLAREASGVPPRSGHFQPMPVPSVAISTATPVASPSAGMIVTGIIGGRSRVAIVQKGDGTYVVGVGDRIGEAVVTAVSENQVVLREHSRAFTLALSTAEASSLSAGGASSTPQGTPPLCVAAPSQTAGVTGPGGSAAAPASPGASAPASATPASSGEPSAEPSGSSSASPPPQPAGVSTGPSTSYAPGIPPGITAPKPTSAVGVQSPIQSGSSAAGSGGPPISYAPGVPPGLTAPKPTGAVGVQSPTPGGPSSTTAAPSQPAGSSTPAQPTGDTSKAQPAAAPGAPPSESAATPSTPARKPPLTQPTLPPC